MPLQLCAPHDYGPKPADPPPVSSAFGAGGRGWNRQSRSGWRGSSTGSRIGHSCPGAAVWDVVIDGCSMRAKNGGELTGPNPPDRGKPGTKHHVVVSTHGLPPALFTRRGSGAHPQDRRTRMPLAARKQTPVSTTGSVGPQPAGKEKPATGMIRRAGFFLEQLREGQGGAPPPSQMQ